MVANKVKASIQMQTLGNGKRLNIIDISQGDGYSLSETQVSGPCDSDELVPDPGADKCKINPSTQSGI